MLAFLSYEEKLLAGSVAVQHLLRARHADVASATGTGVAAARLQGRAGAVLTRLNAAGEVAHEESIGEYAILQRLQQGGAPTDMPLNDYRMIDDDFMLPVVAAHYLLDTPTGRARAAAFLGRPPGRGRRTARRCCATSASFLRQRRRLHVTRTGGTSLP